MTNLNIFLPDSLSNFINEQVAKKGYHNPNEYIFYLINEAQKQAKKEYSL